MNEKYMVNKSNNLVYSRYNLTMQEQRILLSIISMVDSKKDQGFYDYEMKISDFCKLTGIENTNHTYLMNITKQLMTRVVEIKEGNKVIQGHWLSNCVYYLGEGRVMLRLDNLLAPYLLQLKTQFTSYYLSNVLQLKSKFSIRFYEIFKLNEYRNNFIITLDEIRNMLMAENYDTYSYFRQKVLDPAVKEINKYTDIQIKYTPIKTGKKVTSIKFEITDKRKLEQELYGEA